MTFGRMCGRPASTRKHRVPGSRRTCSMQDSRSVAAAPPRDRVTSAMPSSGDAWRKDLMRTITIVESLTLDGVMQAPGGKDEDTRGGFEHGGWAQPYGDEVIGREMGKDMGSTELLFGRRTYEQFASYWPTAPRPNPFSEVLDRTPKHVVSNTLKEPLP